MLCVNLSIDQACLSLCNNCLNSNRTLFKMCAEYYRDIAGFLELLLNYGANYNLTESNIKVSVWKALFIGLDCINTQHLLLVYAYFFLFQCIYVISRMQLINQNI